MEGEEKNGLRLVTECEFKRAEHGEWKELMEIARVNRLGVIKLNEGMAKLFESQSQMTSLLEELKPLRSLPEISSNLSSIVKQLIEPATNPKNKAIWILGGVIAVLSILLIVFVLKENNLTGDLKLFGNSATLESKPVKKTE